MEAAEPEERAWEEKWVEEKVGERKREKIGSFAKVDSGSLVVLVAVVEYDECEVLVAVVSSEDDDGGFCGGGGDGEGGSLKVESFWRGDLCWVVVVAIVN